MSRGLSCNECFAHRVREDNALFLHCQNCDLLAVVVAAHFHPHLAGRHLAVIRKADDCLSFVALVCHKISPKNKFQFNRQ